MTSDYYKEYEKKNPAKFKRRFGIDLLKDPTFLSFIQTRNKFILRVCEKLGKKLKICDVGAGTGLASIELKKTLPRDDFVVEVDYSSHLLSKFKSGGRVCADGLQLPFRDNTFDIVFCMDFLHHVNDIKRGVEDMLRVSKNYVIIIEPNKLNPIYFLYGLVNKEERGILHVGYKKMIRILNDNKYSIHFIEPFPFHLYLMRTPYAWLSKIMEALKLTRLFATYVLIVKKL
jgi:ubiquinone/menaquinone biosynthesis C-methylase UbiE